MYVKEFHTNRKGSQCDLDKYGTVFLVLLQNITYHTHKLTYTEKKNVLFTIIGNVVR